MEKYPEGDRPEPHYVQRRQGTGPVARALSGFAQAVRPPASFESDHGEDVISSVWDPYGGKPQVLMIGGAVDPRRDIVTWAYKKLEEDSWVNRFQLRVFTMDPQFHNHSSIRIWVGEALNPQRINVSTEQAQVESGGWTPKLNFFAFKAVSDPENYVMVSVGKAWNPHVRCKFEIGRHIGTSHEDEGWSEEFTFWLPVRSIC